LHKGLIENCGSIFSMFSWLDSTQPIKIPNLPKTKSKPKAIFIKNLPLINPTTNLEYPHEM
jgi:hypothetical protein